MAHGWSPSPPCWPLKQGCAPKYDGLGQDALWKPGDNVCDTRHIPLAHAHKHWKGKDAVGFILGNGTEPRALPPRAIEREKMNGGIMDIRANSLGS